MKKILLSLLVTICIGLSACATQSTNLLTAEDSGKLKKSKVASSYLMVTKRVNYIETLYRVLWLETKGSSMDISGIWQPDGELGTLINNNLKEASVDSQELKVLITDKAIVDAYQKSLKDEYLSNAKEEHPNIPGTKLPPNISFFHNYPASPSFAALSDRLQRSGIKYLFEYTSSDLYGNAVGYGLVSVVAMSHIRILDLGAKKVVWASPFNTAEVYQLGGDLKKLEEKNLQKLKEGVVAGINKAMEKTKFSAMMGI